MVWVGWVGGVGGQVVVAAEVSVSMNIYFIIASIIKCGVKLRINSQTTTLQLLKFGNEYVIPHYTLPGT